MKIFGIDPAPSKKSTVFDGKEFKHFDSSELEAFVDNLLLIDDNVLICWDAPLTGHPNPESKTNAFDLSDRRIEKYLRSKIKVEGVSILPYSGCPHWTITRRIFGLPRIGKFDSIDVPFNLLTKREDLIKFPKSIVEVHPAISIYGWLESNFERYKGSKSLKGSLIKTISLLKEIPILGLFDIDINSNDELDAYIAFKLGELWVQGTESITLFGNKSGAILLPNVLVEKFSDF